MSTEVTPIEIVDLSDLDLLDDDRAHARCTNCFPGDVSMKVITSICGVEMVQRNGLPISEPPNACEACKEAWPKPCRGCGL